MVGIAVTNIHDATLAVDPHRRNPQWGGSTDVAMQGIANVNYAGWRNVGQIQRVLKNGRVRLVAPHGLRGYDTIEAQRKFSNRGVQRFRVGVRDTKDGQFVPGKEFDRVRIEGWRSPIFFDHADEVGYIPVTIKICQCRVQARGFTLVQCTEILQVSPVDGVKEYLTPMHRKALRTKRQLVGFNHAPTRRFHSFPVAG